MSSSARFRWPKDDSDGLRENLWQQTEHQRMRKSRDFLIFAVDLLSAWDILAGIATGHAALLIYYGTGHAPPPDDNLSRSFWREIILGSVLAGLLLREPKLAAAPKLLASGKLLGVMRTRGLAALALLLVVGLSTRETDDLACSWLLAWSTLFGLCVVMSRIAFLMFVRNLAGRGALREAVAIVALAGARGFEASRLESEADIVLKVYARDDVLDKHDGLQDDAAFDDTALEHVLALGQTGQIDSIVVALGQGHNPELANVVERLKALPVQIVLCQDPAWDTRQTEEIRMFGGIPMAVVANRPIRAWNLLAKLLIDKVLALMGIVLATPLMLVISVAILAESPGPVIFRQCRSGWSGRSFVLFKFRTMRADGRRLPRQTRRNDPRLTRLGAFLRRSSLDELPQLFNVIRGDMSLVGPRPHAEALHTEDIIGQAVVAEYAQRYRVRPGMTGWAQVNGFRGATMSSEQMRRRVEYDLFYIEHWSLWFDIRILALTPFAVFAGENAF
jgi:Undecaprenyl-phosphate glucose phosphotransferase